jgi:predicted oxidoreductase
MCLENKITTFDHADIYGITPPKLTLEKHFLPAKSQRKQLISNVGSKWLPEP